MNATETRSQWTREAYELGQEHGRNAGTWAADGNSSQDHIRRVLAMLEDGDPQAFDYLPKEPNLSGEFADDLTPRSLFEEITGQNHTEAEEDAGLAYETLVGSVIDELADAYEAGASETFMDSCESTLRGFLSDES